LETRPWHACHEHETQCRRKTQAGEREAERKRKGERERERERKRERRVRERAQGPAIRDRLAVDGGTEGDPADVEVDIEGKESWGWGSESHR